MTHRPWLPFALLLATTTAVAAQSHAYGPTPVPGFQGPGALPPHAAPDTSVPSHRMPADHAAWLAEQRSHHPAVQANAVLKEGMDKLLAYLAQDPPNRLQVAAFLDREIAPYFDFDYMARWVAGPAGAGMGEEGRKALAARIEADFLTTLAGHLAGYRGQQVRLLAPRPGPRGAVSINAAILRPGDPPTTLQFRMARSDRGWKVYDVVANGQSAAAYYRSQFQRMAGPR